MVYVSEDWKNITVSRFNNKPQETKSKMDFERSF